MSCPIVLKWQTVDIGNIAIAKNRANSTSGYLVSCLFVNQIGKFAYMASSLSAVRTSGFKLFLILMALPTIVLALNPSRTYKHRPDRFNMNFKESSVKTADDGTLATWTFPARMGSKGTVLVCHNGEGNMADYLRRVDQFLGLGYEVVIFDYRGYGQSSDMRIDTSMYVLPEFQQDIEAMLEHLARRGKENLVIYGWGMGASLALGIGYGDPGTAFIIADTPYLSTEDHIKRLEKIESTVQVPSGMDIRNNPLEALRRPAKELLKGILILVGSNDTFYKLKDYKKLQKIQSQLISTAEIENPEGKDNFRVNKSAYFGQIEKAIN